MPAGPITWADVLKFLIEIGKAAPVDKLFGALRPSRTRSVAEAAGQLGEMGSLALLASLRKEFLATPVRDIPRLPLSAIANVDSKTLQALTRLGLKTIKDVLEDPDFKKMAFLYDLARASSGLRIKLRQPRPRGGRA
jgi:hypothetical protein